MTNTPSEISPPTTMPTLIQTGALSEEGDFGDDEAMMLSSGGIVISLLHPTHSPECPANFASTSVWCPQWGHVKGIVVMLGDKCAVDMDLAK